MAEPDDPAGDLFAIEIGTDDYAETAAGDVPTETSRTHQSEAEFQAQKASYAAKVDDGNLLGQLYQVLPLLSQSATSGTNGVADDSQQLQHRCLDKREVQLLGYAVGELYYDKKFPQIVDLCNQMKQSYNLDVKTTNNIEKWKIRSQERISTTP